MTGTSWEQVMCPVMSFWECVGGTVDHVSNNTTIWRKMGESIVQVEPTGLAKHTIASYLCSYLDEQMLVAQLYFLRGYVRTWWGPHFEWHKHIDPETDMRGFLGVHMSVHYFIQHFDFELMTRNWQTMDEFLDFVRLFPASATFEKEKLVMDFFTRDGDSSAYI